MNTHSSLHYRQGNIGLTVLIFLVIFTLLFGTFAYIQYKHVEAVQTGDKAAKISPDKSIHKLGSKIKDQQKIIDEHNAYLDHLREASHQYDLKIASHGEFYVSGYMVPEGGGDAEEFKGLIGLLGDDAVYTHNSQASKIINHDHDNMKMWEAHYRSTGRQDLPKLKEAKTTFEDATNDIIESSSTFEESKQNEIDKLQEDLEALKDRQEDLKVKQRYDESVALTQKAQLEAKIRQLLELELRWLKELESDGRLLQTGLDFDFIIVNIGRKEGVLPGMRFDIFNYERGTYVTKGRCEVIKVDETISTCRVVHIIDKRKNPISTGDHIGNPIFDTTSPKSFFLAGEFKIFNKEDIARFIVKGGGVIYDKLQPGVDFLIAGERSNKDQDQAREYNVLAMSEDTIVQYIHATFGTQAISKP
ncbi:MAG: hypothetical protein HRU15_18115 [Planctomycetes bacterium]|nr:hypothetical protein [Planctomycetota bacterium]